MSFTYSPTPNIGLWGADHGLSEEAAYLREIAAKPRTASPSFVLGERLREAFYELEEAYSAAFEEGWDGYGGLPAQSAAYPYAAAILQTLPSAVPVPEISIDPDGEIGLDWLLAPRLRLSISISGTGRLSYAGIFGPNRAHGAEQFVDSLPKAVADSIARLFTEGRRLRASPA
jgi:hypothetical protein